MVYASVATGFKGGGSNPRPFNAYQLICLRPGNADGLRSRRQDPICSTAGCG